MPVVSAGLLLVRHATGASATGAGATGAGATGAGATGASATGAGATGAGATGTSATGANATGTTATGVSTAGTNATSPLEVFIAHMGGPFWARKREGAWSIPKGEYDPATEHPLTAARREFAEELGTPAPEGEPTDLGEFRYSSGKRLRVFALEAPAFELAAVVSNTFEMEWPPRSGRRQSFPEIDDARWAAVDDARPLLVAGQRPVLDAALRAFA